MGKNEQLAAEALEAAQNVIHIYTGIVLNYREEKEPDMEYCDRAAERSFRWLKGKRRRKEHVTTPMVSEYMKRFMAEELTTTGV